MRYPVFPGLLAVALITGLSPGSVIAQEADPEHDEDRVHGPAHDHESLEEIIVTASPLGRDVVELSQSATVLGGDALAREAANNIGDTLSRLPGLANASFGQNVGRPVIRGLQGARVGVLKDNMTSEDASAVSQDHAIPIEPFLADQVEVLRGPSTLLYGSGAIGGVVNIVTDTIPDELPEMPVEGRFLLQADSAAAQRFGAGRIDLAKGRFAIHASGFYRQTDDYEIPGDAHLYEDDEDHAADETPGILENSFLDNQGGAIGASWIGNSWHFGLSWTDYESDYGIPGAHAHEHGDAAAEPEEEEENVTIALTSDRWDGELVGSQPFAGFEQLKLKLASTHYEHTEFEGAQVGTVFESEAYDSRLELKHLRWSNWSGVFGGQYTDRDFSATGEEAFVPPSATTTAALFWVESADFADWRIDLGIRFEEVDTVAQALEHGQATDVVPVQYFNRSFSPFSASAGVVWHVDERSHLALTLARAERAPTDQELFADGPHIATQTFEQGSRVLDIEANTHWEAAYRIHQGPVTGSVTVYFDDFDDYIYQADTGIEIEGLALRIWSQQDAEFIGAEVELRWDVGHNRAGHWQLFGFYDRVKATLKDGGYVPLIPPQRIGLGLDWDHHSWVGNLVWISASSHTRTASYETPTPGYDLVNAEISYLLPVTERVDWIVYLQGRNLLDDDIRNSTSFLKDQAPQIGRNLVLGIKASF